MVFSLIVLALMVLLILGEHGALAF